MSLPKKFTFKIVLTGPESSGKTKMARDLAQQLSALYVPEFARYYLAHLGRPYEQQDLETIARGQQHWENWFGTGFPSVLVCDTDWTVLQIWEHYRFGKPADNFWHWKSGYVNPQPANLYFLCAPDFPWEPDPLREHPQERDTLFRWYTDLLEKQHLTYRVLKGPHATRLETAISEVRKLFRPL